MRFMRYVFEPIWQVSYRHMALMHMNYGFAIFVCYVVISLSNSCSVASVFPPQHLS